MVYHKTFWFRLAHTDSSVVLVSGYQGLAWNQALFAFDIK